MKTNTKIKNIIWPVIYLILTVMVVVSFSIGFKAQYFQPIYISGTSMQPTLNSIKGYDSSWHHYGYIDTHKAAIDNLDRFNIVTTYYPFSSFGDYVGKYNSEGENKLSENASYKIKRVYAFPGEQFKFSVGIDKETQEQTVNFYVRNGGATVWGEPLEIPFERKIAINRGNNPNFYEYESPVLGEKEYFVMGDNYIVSADCYSETISSGRFSPIYYENIQGVLIAIEGICKITNNGAGDGVGLLSTFSKHTRKPFLSPIYFI